MYVLPIWYLVSRWGLGPKVCMHHFGCGMNWIKGYYMIVKVQNETFWFSSYSVEMHSLTSSSFIICFWGETFGSRTILSFFFFLFFPFSFSLLPKFFGPLSALFPVLSPFFPFQFVLPLPIFSVGGSLPPAPIGYAPHSAFCNNHKGYLQCKIWNTFTMIFVEISLKKAFCIFERITSD